MVKQKFEVEVEVPDGYEIIGYCLPKEGDNYLYGGSITTCHVDWSCGEAQFILQKAARLSDLKQGDKFTFQEGGVKFTILGKRSFNIIWPSTGEIIYIFVDEENDLCGTNVDEKVTKL